MENNSLCGNGGLYGQGGNGGSYTRWIASYYMVNPLPEHPAPRQKQFPQEYEEALIKPDMAFVLMKLDAILSCLEKLTKKTGKRGKRNGR